MKRIILITVFLSAFIYANAQTYTQSISGRVLDEVTNSPLIGATIKVADLDPIKGAVADINGYFEIKNVPVGRHRIEVTFIGYDAVTIPNVLVSSGKSVQLDIRMKESQVLMDEIVVVAEQEKEKPLNEMATVSARSFTVEETRRYAGGFDDPARLASSFAGVTINNLADNGIVIRGNAPKSVQWRIEGVEVPNPSHFQGADVAGAGFFTLLSSHTLANSDFFTGAFPAEYGNALSGVFDINLRTGNPFDREHTFQAGVIGIDFASEGPFKEGKRATYLFNYRYSTFGLLRPILPDGMNSIYYQDLSFKLHFPTKKWGTFEVWGVGGNDRSKSHKEPIADSTKWEYSIDFTDLTFGFDVGSMGINHKYPIGDKAYLKTVLSASANNSFYEEDVIHPAEGVMYDENTIDQEFYNYIGSIQLNYKHSPKWNSRVGLIASAMDNYVQIKSALKRYEPETVVSVDENQYERYQGYVQSKYYFSPNLFINLGLHSQYSELVDEVSVEPRLSFSWNYSSRSSIAFGYGKHSMLEDIKIYSVVDPAGNFINNDLKFTKAHHYVLSWDSKINGHARIKVEPYYQWLFDVPVIKDSTFSMLNFRQDWFFNGDLDPIGNGRNYGVDVTLERFMYNQFYYLVTASFFKSEYKDGLGEWRPTRFDRNYSINLLGGKEWTINDKKNKLLGLNLRMNFLGGQRRSPLDTGASLAAKKEVLDESDPFTDREMPMHILDLTLTIRKNKNRSSSVWAFQVKNVLASKADYGYSYNYLEDEMQHDNLGIVIPNISYKIEF